MLQNYKMATTGASRGSPGTKWWEKGLHVWLRMSRSWFLRAVLWNTHFFERTHDGLFFCYNVKEHANSTCKFFSMVNTNPSRPRPREGLSANGAGIHPLEETMNTKPVLGTSRNFPDLLQQLRIFVSLCPCNTHFLQNLELPKMHALRSTMYTKTIPISRLSFWSVRKYFTVSQRVSYANINLTNAPLFFV